jgi:hypothetical protein
MSRIINVYFNVSLVVVLQDMSRIINVNFNVSLVVVLQDSMPPKIG